MEENSPQLAPQWIKRGASLNTTGNKLGNPEPFGLGDHRDTRTKAEERPRYEVNSRGAQQQLRPASSSSWASTSKPAQQQQTSNRGQQQDSTTPRSGFAHAPERNSRREAVPVRVHDLLTAADPLGARVVEVYRTASVPPPSANSFTNGTHPKAAFDTEFPSLRDSGPAHSNSVAEANHQPIDPAPASKQAPYRPSYLAERVNTNWTSKLADAPTPNPAGEPASPAPDSPPPPTPPRTPQAAQQPEPTPQPPPLTTQLSGWGAPSINGHNGDGGRSKLLDTLSGNGGASSQQTSVQDAGAFRAQLAVRQSKQLIPVLARKTDKPGDSANGNGGSSKAGPATHGSSARPTLMGTVAMMRQSSTGTERLLAAVPAAAQGGVGPDGKLQLRPLGPRRPGPAAAGAQGNGEEERAPSGMVALCRSPPPSARKLAGTGMTEAASEVRASSSSNGGAAPAAQPIQLNQGGTDTAKQQGAPATVSAGVQQSPQPAVAIAAQRPVVGVQLPHGKVVPPPPGFGPPATTSPIPTVHADVSSGLLPVRTSASGAPTPATLGLQFTDEPESRHNAVWSSTFKSAPGPGSKASADLAVVPADELAFLVSLGWSGEEEDGGDGDALTEEEIAAFRAASAHSRCSTPQLRFSNPTSRTTSPAPYFSSGLGGPMTVSSPGYARVPMNGGRAMRGSNGSTGYEGSGIAMIAKTPTAGGGVGEACQVVVELDPLFPGVSPGWFAALASPRGSRDSQDGLPGDAA